MYFVITMFAMSIFIMFGQKMPHYSKLVCENRNPFKILFWTNVQKVNLVLEYVVYLSHAFRSQIYKFELTLNLIKMIKTVVF